MLLLPQGVGPLDFITLCLCSWTSRLWGRP